MAARIVVGTSSWADPGFVEEWYPEGLPARDRLPYYAERFEAVEVNSTFYDDAELGEIAERAESLAEQVQERAAVHFNTDRGDDAPVAAQRYLEVAGARA